ncbi:MAG: RES family NAD+ phosphorylase [Gemmatimonadales bacterium]
MAGFEPRHLAISLWRAVEAQHVVATRLLVDSREEQRLLEDLLDPGKPAVPAEARGLHYLLFTPFRYPPTALGSRFRRPADPGVFYGADLIRTACAELGYWRWRFLVDSPALESISPAAQTLFRVAVSGRGIDLREPPWTDDTARWTDPADYGPCQQLAATARREGVAIIRYQSVRDPESSGAAAVLDPGAFAAPEPLERETWYLGVTRDRVWWVRDRLHGPDAGFDFPMARWRGTA